MSGTSHSRIGHVKGLLYIEVVYSTLAIDTLLYNEFGLAPRIGIVKVCLEWATNLSVWLISLV